MLLVLRFIATCTAAWALTIFTPTFAVDLTGEAWPHFIWLCVTPTTQKSAILMPLFDDTTFKLFQVLDALNTPVVALGTLIILF